LATTALPNAPPVLVEQTKQLIRTVYRHALDRLQIKHLPDSAITWSVGELDYNDGRDAFRFAPGYHGGIKPAK
jgi:hypothetical protein